MAVVGLTCFKAINRLPQKRYQRINGLRTDTMKVLKSNGIMKTP